MDLETTIIRSHRPTPKVEKLYVFIESGDDGVEGVVRRSTPYGTQPLICDDQRLVNDLMEIAVDVATGTVRVAEFVRVP